VRLSSGDPYWRGRAGRHEGGRAERREIVICNCGGSFHAVDRRCGHMNAPLEMEHWTASFLPAPCIARI